MLKLWLRKTLAVTISPSLSSLPPRPTSKETLENSSGSVCVDFCRDAATTALLAPTQKIILIHSFCLWTCLCFKTCMLQVQLGIFVVPLRYLCSIPNTSITITSCIICFGSTRLWSNLFASITKGSPFFDSCK